MVNIRTDADNYPETFGITIKRHKEIWNDMCKIIGNSGPHHKQKEIIKYISSLATDEEKVTASFSLGTMLGEERSSHNVKDDIAKNIFGLSMSISMSGEHDPEKIASKVMSLAVSLAKTNTHVSPAPVGDDDDDDDDDDNDNCEEERPQEIQIVEKEEEEEIKKRKEEATKVMYR